MDPEPAAAETAIQRTPVDLSREAWSFGMSGSRLRVSLRASRSLPAVEEIAHLAREGVEVEIGHLEQLTSTVIAWLFALKRLLRHAPMALVGAGDFERGVLMRSGADRVIQIR